MKSQVSAGAESESTAAKDPIERFVREIEWRSTKTAPQWPHWHVLKSWNPERESEFVELVRRIFEEGRDDYWGTGDSRKLVRSYRLGAHKYWVTNPTIEATDLINRARIERYGITQHGGHVISADIQGHIPPSADDVVGFAFTTAPEICDYWYTATLATAWSKQPREQWRLVAYSDAERFRSQQAPKYLSSMHVVFDADDTDRRNELGLPDVETLFFGG
jgi:hypothetical protein